MKGSFLPGFLPLPQGEGWGFTLRLRKRLRASGQREEGRAQSGLRSARQGSPHPARHRQRPPAAIHRAGFTILELLVVVAIIAFATAGVSLSLRDSSQTQLEREGQRLATLFESARAQSRANGSAVIWRVTAEGFRFEGLPPNALPAQWLSGDVAVRPGAAIQLGPEPIIGAQVIELSSISQPGRSLRVATDGLRPFAVQLEGNP